ncbi:hypothetical protein [Novosphingobium mathurense]|uniref:Glucosyl transferase GtrII n=1 Tax=Novosphingobium mathurense TaxID=428990 RepID=A0A1U6IR89_9SPHN|nr:hypothetical protein [Novosphingobium mathurense]SLK10557.1 hypothetical protein SAMN06295987_11214 [Novosphingobium mathurense]
MLPKHLSKRAQSWTARPWNGPASYSPDGSHTFSPGQKFILLAGFLLLIVLRLPQVWQFGRFFCEEGTIFFSYAWHRPASEALWRSFAGYTNLAANASTLLTVALVRSGAIVLENAPYATMGIATLFQLLPAALILTGKGTWLDNRSAVIASLLIVAISPMTEEVFANVLHIQFHLALCVGLILALDVPARRRARVSYGVLLFLAPLCGPGAIILLPLFCLRALTDKDAGRITQSILLGTAAAIQLLFFYTASPLRGDLLDPVSLLNLLFVRLGVMPLLSAPIANLYGVQVFAASRDQGIVWLGTTLLAFAYFAALLAFASRSRKDPAIWLVSSGLLVASVTFGAGMLPLPPGVVYLSTAAQRYNFVPLTLIGIGLVAMSTRASSHFTWVFRGLTFLFLASGALTYAAPLDDMAHGPDWRDEVAKWRLNNQYRPKVWPVTWEVDLSSDHRPCPAKADDSGELLYCEGAWTRQVLKDSGAH